MPVPDSPKSVEVRTVTDAIRGTSVRSDEYARLAARSRPRASRKRRAVPRATAPSVSRTLRREAEASLV